MAASRWALQVLFRLVAKTPEVLLIAAISWCFLVSYAAAKADFSIAMGALIAGVSSRPSRIPSTSSPRFALCAVS